MRPPVECLYNNRVMKTLLKKLVKAESTAQAGELAAAKVIRRELSRSGIDAHIDTWDENRANLMVRLKSKAARPALLFACHLDVVPPGQAGWSKPAFEPVERAGRIYGRGSADMKGGITALITAARQLVDLHAELKGDLIILAAAGEETDSCGARRFMAGYSDKLPPIAGVVLPEPTDFEVVTAHRGLLWLEVTTCGKTAHGSTPHLGINAITSMKAVLAELENYQVKAEPHELLGQCSLSVNTIQGGEAINVVPDRCSIGVDIRTLPGQNHQDIIYDLERVLDKLRQENCDFQAEVSVIRQVDALETDSRCDFVRDFCSCVGVNRTKAVGFTTDGPHFAELAAPVVVFGPGKPELCHKPDEYIEIADVEKAATHYKSIILKCLT